MRALATHGSRSCALACAANAVAVDRALRGSFLGWLIGSIPFPSGRDHPDVVHGHSPRPFRLRNEAIRRDSFGCSNRQKPLRSMTRGATHPVDRPLPRVSNFRNIVLTHDRVKAKRNVAQLAGLRAFDPRCPLGARCRAGALWVPSLLVYWRVAAETGGMVWRS